MTKQPKETPVSEQDAAQAFMNDYQELCKKHGYHMVITPVYKISQDTGTWSTVLQVSVGKLLKE